MPRRSLVDHKLQMKAIPVRFSTGAATEARAEGNNAAWVCDCGTLLVGRCYYQFGDTCHTECPDCGRQYRVVGDSRKRAELVVEEEADLTKAS